MTTRPSPIDAAASVRDDLMTWLTTEALPIWWGFGIDHHKGGFREKLGLRCEIRPDPRRVRVQARQVYTFAVAGRLGWTGPWKSAVEMGVRYFLDRAVQPNASVRRVIGDDGAPLDDRFELYDHAFALFALAAAATVVEDRDMVERAAVRIRDHLHATVRHPVTGFEEANPRSLPLKANPHMHLFEASLAWVEAGGDAAWGDLADEIARLCLNHFLHPESGWLREFFDGDWRPMPGDEGRIVEPGHQFEWAWLLARWARLRDQPDALAAARRLVALSEASGVDPARGVAMNELLDDGSVRDGGARLWPQTERIKGHVALALSADDLAARDGHLEKAAEAGRALLLYLDVATPGLWRDRMEPDGSFRIEPAPASSFYHIICGIEELDRALKTLGR